MVIKRLIYLIVIFGCLTLTAQKQVPLNLPVYDHQTLHFGMALGYNQMDFTIHNSAMFNSLDSVYSIENISKSGFNINIVSNLNLNKHLSIRALPGLNFGQRNLEYISHSRVDSVFFLKVMMIESTFLDIPVLIKYKAKRLNNFRPYVVGGGAFKWDLASQKSIRDEDRPKIRLKSWDMYYSVGIGADFFLQYFKFALELRVDIGIRNIVVPDGSQYSMAIERMNSKMFHVTALFEGSDIRSFTGLFKKKK